MEDYTTHHTTSPEKKQKKSLHQTLNKLKYVEGKACYESTCGQTDTAEEDRGVNSIRDGQREREVSYGLMERTGGLGREVIKAWCKGAERVETWENNI